MRVAARDKVRLHWREDGDPDGVPLVFANSLGTDLRLWDEVVQRLPGGLRLVRFDKRGHGLSSCPKGPYSLEDLTEDTEQLLTHLGIASCVFVGLSIGGSEDGACAPEIVRATTALIPGSRFAEIKGAGHLPCVEKPDDFVALLSAFLKEIADD